MITFSRLEKCGRLGNQLFQIAGTAGIAQKMGQPAGFLRWSYQPFFNVPPELFPEDYMQRRWPVTQAHQTQYVEHMDPRAREYLQDYNLWSDISSQVWDWFQPSEAANQYALSRYDWFFELPRPILSVHVRRGDNAKAPNNYHPLRPFSYYEEAIASLAGEFESICVFSDDPEWCRTAFSYYAVEYNLAFFVGTPRVKEHEKAYFTDPVLDWIDLQFMARCDAWILGNSTYAWWGAWLGSFHRQNPSVIYPSPWFGQELQYIDSSLMFPDIWTKIEHGQIIV